MASVWSLTVVLKLLRVRNTLFAAVCFWLKCSKLSLYFAPLSCFPVILNSGEMLRLLVRAASESKLNDVRDSEIHILCSFPFVFLSCPFEALIDSQKCFFSSPWDWVYYFLITPSGVYFSNSVNFQASTTTFTTWRCCLTKSTEWSSCAAPGKKW